MNYKPRPKIILYVLAAIFVLIVVADAVFYFIIRERAETVQALRQDFYTNNAESYNLFKIERDTTRFNELENSLRGVFLPEKEIISFIESIEQLGLDQNVIVTIKAVDVADSVAESTNSTYGTFSATFTVSGAWVDVSDFIRIIETLPYYARISSLDLDSTTTKQGVTWNAAIALSVAVLLDN